MLQVPDARPRSIRVFQPQERHGITPVAVSICSDVVPRPLAEALLLLELEHLNGNGLFPYRRGFRGVDKLRLVMPLDISPRADILVLSGRREKRFCGCG